jgi:hypothetical protein
MVASVRSVSALAIQRQLRRHRRDLAVIATVLAIAGLLALHHSGLLTDDMQRHAGMGTVVQMCLGVVTALGTVVLAAALAVGARGRAQLTPRLLPAGALSARVVPVTRARHGPAAVSCLCVSRR